MSTGEGNGPRERALAKGFFHVIFVLRRRATTRLISISRSRESPRFVVPDRAGNRRATNRGPLGCIHCWFWILFCFNNILRIGFLFLFFFIYVLGNISKKLWIFLRYSWSWNLEDFSCVRLYFPISFNSVFYIRVLL